MITFIRIDDRMIHGQTCTRWAIEYPCTGLIAVNDKAATNSVLKAAYKNGYPRQKDVRLDCRRLAGQKGKGAGVQRPVFPHHERPRGHGDGSA